MATRSSSRLKSTQSSKIAAASKVVPVPRRPIDSRGKRDTQASEKPTDAEPSARSDREFVDAFLRIRPHSGVDVPTATSSPYLIRLSETVVRMTEPAGVSLARHRYGVPDSQYTFTRVFGPETSQEEFFSRTTLPLIESVLNGENSLLFAYGVTNSGKTYSIQGGKEEGTAGILPRTLDVIFNSVENSTCDAPYRPVRLSGVENSQHSVTVDGLPISDGGSNLLSTMWFENTKCVDVDKTVISVDSDHEYAIWASYAEIYNERVFDLLAENEGVGRVNSTPSRNPNDFAPTTGSHDRPRNALLVQRKALTLKTDIEGGKYVSGLKEVRIRNAEEGKQIVKLGQLNRRVFGTLANQASSRSHAIFTVKVMRVPRGFNGDPCGFRTARLSIVDLAGSERSRNTQNTGERLKEAGNINKSLMVLGQCLEILRNNQKKCTAPQPNTSKLAIVPFRHSRLTELFQDFFVGNGKATMIVNVNPYDTGFDENSQVMKFSALAQEVATVAKGRLDISPQCNRRKVKIPAQNEDNPLAEDTYFEVLEEDADDDENENENEGSLNPLVDALFDEIENLRKKLHDSEMQAALVEAEVREEITRDMAARMREMEQTYAKRLLSELEYNERKMDQKIDMLYRAGHFGSSVDNEMLVE